MENNRWAAEWARFMKSQMMAVQNSSLPAVDTAEVLTIKPFIVIQAANAGVSYDEDDVVWGIDSSKLSVGDIVILQRDPSEQPIVTSVLDGNDPDPTNHPAGLALAQEVASIHEQAKFWRAPVATLAELNATTTDADGTVRGVLATNQPYRWNATTSAWVEFPLAGGGGSDASATVKGITKLSVAPVVAANPIAVGDNDSRMTDARTPAAHATSHKSGGSDTFKIHELTVPTAATPMGSQKFTGLAAGTANGDSVRYEQVLLLTGGTLSGDATISHAGAATFTVLSTDSQAEVSVDAFTGSSAYFVGYVNGAYKGAFYAGATTVGIDGKSPGYLNVIEMTQATGDVLVGNATGTLKSGAPLVPIGAGTDLATVGAVSTALTANATADRARANHTGTQLAATVSDFDTQVRTSKIHQMTTPTAVTPMGGFGFTGLGTLEWGGDTNLARTAANILGIGAGDKFQQNAAPTVGDDLVNKTYVDNLISFANQMKWENC